MKATDIFKVMDMAERAIKLKRNFNPMFVGAPGIAKSQIVQQWAHKNGYMIKDIRLANMEAPDMIGLYDTRTIDGKDLSINFLPEFWPHEQESKGVLILEEINRAPPSVLNGCMELLTERKVQKYALPPGWILVSCVNPENSEYDVNIMDFALKDRFEIFQINYDKHTFIDYMKKKEFDPDVVMFIESGSWGYKKPEELSNLPGTKYLSPRSWEKFDTALKCEIPIDLTYEIYEEMLGTITGKDFYAFKHNERPITFHDLKENIKTSLERLKVYSSPDNYKSALINITVKSLVDNAPLVEDELLIKVCLNIPADKGVDLIKQMEFKTKDDSILNRVCSANAELLKYFKVILKKEKKS